MSTERRPRKRRIAADEAHAWARNLKLKNPSAKYILCMLSLYVDDRGFCYPSIATLAEDTECSEPTVRSRLKFLEEVGAVARFAMWVDDKGVRNRDGRGRRTTDDIRLLYEGDPDLIESNADRGNPKAGTDPETGRGQELAGQNLDPQTETRGQLGVSQGSDSVDPSDSSEPEPEDSPPTPPPGGAEADSQRQGGQAAPEWLGDYPIPDNHPARTAALCAALPPDEQERLRLGVLGAKEHRRKHPKDALPALWKFIRDGAYKSYADAAPKAAEVLDVRFDSDAGLAMLVLYRIAGRGRPFAYTKGGYECCMRRLPLNPRMMACAQAPYQRQWQPVTSAQFAAWRQFLEEEQIPHPIGDFKAPWAWPPRKDGTLYDGSNDDPSAPESPPETNLLTDEDEQFLKDQNP